MVDQRTYRQMILAADAFIALGTTPGAHANRQSDFRRSNRDQTETPNSTSKSLTYDALMCKRWDTTDGKWMMNAVIPGWASSVVPIYFLGGIELLSIGILGEYIAKIYLETKKRPRFFIEKRI